MSRFKFRLSRDLKIHLFILVILVSLTIVPGRILSEDSGDEGGKETQPTPEATPVPQSEETTLTPPPPTEETEVTVQKLTPEQMSQFQDRLENLRTRILKSKARLLQLKEQLMLGTISIISLTVTHTQNVSGTFQLQTLTYSLDGFDIYTGVTSPENRLEKMENHVVWEGSLLPGEHLLTLDMVFRGKGYNLFSYLNQYLFKVKSRYVFTVSEGDVIKIHVVAYDEGSFMTSLKDRLKVKFNRE